MSNWNNVYITDKTGRKMWNTTASPMSTLSELKNLQMHIVVAQERPHLYKFLDVATAKVMLNGIPYVQEPVNLDMTNDELLAELTA